MSDRRDDATSVISASVRSGGLPATAGQGGCTFGSDSFRHKPNLPPHQRRQPGVPMRTQTQGSTAGRYDHRRKSLSRGVFVASIGLAAHPETGNFYRQLTWVTSRAYGSLRMFAVDIVRSLAWQNRRRSEKSRFQGA